MVLGVAKAGHLNLGLRDNSVRRYGRDEVRKSIFFPRKEILILKEKATIYTAAKSKPTKGRI